MRVSTPFGFAFSVAALLLSGSALTGTLTPAQIQQSAQGAETDVIVILRDQLASVPPRRGAGEARSAAIAQAQTPIFSELRQAGAKKIQSFRLINALATTVSQAEVARLAAHPLVQAVVPDLPIRQRQRPDSNAVAGGAAGAVAAASASSALCNTLEPEALQLTNAAFPNSSTPQAQNVLDGNGKPVLGTGVKVAFVADGLDTTVPGFIRPDGSSVFVDYQDFSGDPAGTPTAGGEAFGDASSIAAQDHPKGKLLTYDISQFVNPAHPLPSPCLIQIRGMAPGASLVGLKVFSNLGYTTTSSFVQAIDYAVFAADVDVINESFGGSPFPDNDNDPISLADTAAVNAGVTVVVSTGDAGTAGTVESPSTNSDVIGSGATTQFRFYAQTGYGAIPLGNGTYVDNNISAFSSAGFSQSGARVPSTVAPGDLSWALCSTNTALYTDCVSFAGTATAIESFGGTSESSPLTAGEAALVIQAYRSTHRGVNPTPALVKQIIMSTAADMGAPAFEQGSGLINALAAVNAALSVQDANGGPKTARGDSLLYAPTESSITDMPGTHESLSYTVTNTGSTTQNLAPVLQTLGAPIAGATLNLNINASSSQTFLNVTGSPRAYISRTLNVPAGAQHLDAAIAWVASFSNPNPPYAYFALFDPSGREVTYSIPQGAGSAYGHTDVVMPAAGKWTVFIWVRPPTLAGSYTGPVQFTWAAEKYVTLGSVTPASFSLAPGASAAINAQFKMPSQPGDLAAAIRFGQSADLAGTSQAEIPLSLRTLIQTSATGGTFSGALTGGNGRPGTGPTQTFAFNVPSGVSDMSLLLEIPDNGYLVEGLLVDPHGMQLSVNANIDPSGNTEFGLQHFRYNPQPGQWRFVLLQDFFSSGNQTSLPFSGRIAFNTAQVSAPRLPDSSKVQLKAGTAVRIPVVVTNTGAVTLAYFADARLNTLAATQLQFSDPGACGPTELPGTCTEFFVPTEVSGILFAAQSSVPITMDAYNGAGFYVGVSGTPDLWAHAVGTDTVVAATSAPEVPYGPWFEVPALKGPYGSKGAPTEPVTTSAFVLMQPFDPAVSSDAGDIWADLTLNTTTYKGLVLAAGQQGTIHVTITPSQAQVGTTVNGYLYIDTYSRFVATGDEVVRIPYSYSVIAP